MQNNVEAEASSAEVRVLQFSIETEAGAGTLLVLLTVEEPGALWGCDGTALNVPCAHHRCGRSVHEVVPSAEVPMAAW